MSSKGLVIDMETKVISYDGKIITPEEASLLAEGLQIKDHEGSLVLTYKGEHIRPENAKEIVRTAEWYKDVYDLKAQLREQGIRKGDRVRYGTYHHVYIYNDSYQEPLNTFATKAEMKIVLDNTGMTHLAGIPLKKVHSDKTIMKHIPNAVHRRTARNVVTKGLGLSVYSNVGKTMRNLIGPPNLFVPRPPHGNRRRAGSNVAAEFRNPPTISKHSSESRSRSSSRSRRRSRSSRSRRR